MQKLLVRRGQNYYLINLTKTLYFSIFTRVIADAMIKYSFFFFSCGLLGVYGSMHAEGVHSRL